MAFSIRYDVRAAGELEDLRRYDARRVVERLEQQLSRRPNNVEGDKKLITLETGEQTWQLSVGIWRVFYDVDVAAQEVVVRRVRHKGRSRTEEIL